MRILLMILLTVAVSMTTYMMFIRSAGAGGSSAVGTISAITVKVELLNIAQAEKMYYVQNSAYGTMDQLATAGTFTAKTPDPDNYTYSAETTATGFKITGRHDDDKGGPSPDHPTMAIDESMHVQTVN